jgi:hypothetical protein
LDENHGRRNQNQKNEFKQPSEKNSSAFPNFTAQRVKVQQAKLKKEQVQIRKTLFWREQFRSLRLRKT